LENILPINKNATRRYHLLLSLNDKTDETDETCAAVICFERPSTDGNNSNIDVIGIRWEIVKLNSSEYYNDQWQDFTAPETVENLSASSATISVLKRFLPNVVVE
jgi:hypothetical protein